MSSEGDAGLERGDLQPASSQWQSRLSRAGTNLQHPVTGLQAAVSNESVEQLFRIFRPSVLIEFGSLIKRRAQPVSVVHGP